MGKLNGQIAHPSYSRTSTDNEKLSAKDRTTLMKFIEGELDRFSNEMKENYKQHWPSDMMSTTSGGDTEPFVRVLGPAGATGQIGTIGPAFTTAGPRGPTGPAAPMFIYRTDDGGESR
jgi:hypothetical protein